MAASKKSSKEVLLPAEISYCKEHAWSRREGDFVRVGITDYAQDQLGEIIFIELPEIGSTYNIGKAFGCAESTKSVSSLYMPIGGEIIETNTDIEQRPELVNQDPYGIGWMILVKPNDIEELKTLLSADSYRCSL